MITLPKTQFQALLKEATSPLSLDLMASPPLTKLALSGSSLKCHFHVQFVPETA